MKIAIIVFIFLTIYYMTLLIFVYKGNWRSMFSICNKNTGNEAETTRLITFDETKIMGKSHGFSIAKIAEPESLEIELDMEYEAEQELLDEETIELEEMEFSNYSTGVTFEELQNVTEIVLQQDTPEEIESNAGELISKINQTDMFEMLIQLSGRNYRVVELLKNV